MNLKIKENFIADQALSYGLNNDLLQKLSVVVNDKDGMFEPNKEGSTEHYLSVGIQALNIIVKNLSIINVDTPKKILDFGCGHGRVMRFLSAYFPNTEMIGTEVIEDCIDFCSNTFGVKTFISTPDFSNLPQNLDAQVVWAGSVFTHISEKRYKELLRYFSASLSVGGIAIFTTHGRKAEEFVKKRVYGLSAFNTKKILFQYNLNGFGYADYMEIKNYGTSINTPAWFCKMLKKEFPEFRLISYTEQYWDNHQDVICIQKIC